MTQLEQEIKTGEGFLKAYRETLAKMQTLNEKKDDKATLYFLLDLIKSEYEGKCLSVETRLLQLKKEQVLEFERMSAESNMNMSKVLTRAKEFFGRDPKSVTAKMESLYHEYKPFMNQGRKNEIFFELKGHIDFLTKTYQNK